MDFQQVQAAIWAVVPLGSQDLAGSIVFEASMAESNAAWSFGKLPQVNHRKGP